MRNLWQLVYLKFLVASLFVCKIKSVEVRIAYCLLHKDDILKEGCYKPCSLWIEFIEIGNAVKIDVIRTRGIIINSLRVVKCPSDLAF